MMCQCRLPPVEILSHLWVSRVERGGGLEEGVRPVACGKRGNRCSAWAQSGVRSIPCTEATTPSKGFLHLKTPHMVTVRCILSYNTIYFYPLQVKSKPREGVTTLTFILGLAGMVVNSSVYISAPWA